MKVRKDGAVEPNGNAEKYDLIPYAEFLTGSASIAPDNGTQRLQLVWAQIIPNSDNTSSNPVTITMTINGVLTDVYAVYALGRSAVFTGDPGTDIDITLGNTQTVSVNIQYRKLD